MKRSFSSNSFSSRSNSNPKSFSGRSSWMSSTSSTWGDAPQRLATICIGVPVLWMLWSNTRTRFSFFQGVHAIMCWEYCQLMSSSQNTRCVFALVSIVLTNIHDTSLFLLLLVTCIALSYILQSNGGDTIISNSGRGGGSYSNNNSNSNNSNDNNNIFITGLFLITIPCRTWLMVQEDFHHTVSLLLTVWNADTGALITGRLARNIRLYAYYHGGGGGKKYSTKKSASSSSSLGTYEPEWLRRISPNKSVIGLIGGIVGGTVTYMSLPMFWNLIYSFNLAPAQQQQYDHDDFSSMFSSSSSMSSSTIHTAAGNIADDAAAAALNVTNATTATLSEPSPSSSQSILFLLDAQTILIGLSLSLAAILGDLWESSVKRKYGTKDMGRLLPGHGGVLDRFDSSLLAVLLYQYYIEQAIL